MFVKKATLFILLIISIFACNKFKNPVSGDLSFSNDTVFFDTIFTQIGSTTKQFKVYNKTNTPILINKVYVSGGDASKYRLNIDGYSSNSVDDIVIDANDSMYVFVEVTIDPAKDDIVETDSLFFVSGDNFQGVQLLAVGRDVHLINGQRIQTQTWTADKPYLIYNSVLVDTLETLTLEPGVEIYSHRYSGFFVKGTLIADGTKDLPITFRGDRIDEEYYFDKPGQWNGIVLMQGSFDNYFNHVIVSEGFYGIAVDSSINLDVPTLFVNNSNISHSSFAGIYALKTNLTVINSIISDCGVHTVGLFMSGIYNFYNCTLQNDYRYSSRNTPSVGMMNYWVDDDDNVHFAGTISAYFANCIVNGNQKNEFVAHPYDGNNMSYLFENCLMKLDLEVNDTSLNVFKNCIMTNDSLYVDIDKFDYHLYDESPARKKASTNVISANLSFLGHDMDGVERLSDGTADIGALEYE